METVKGFSDFVGKDALKRRKIKEIIEKYFKLYGFEPAETPIVEYEEFAIGENQNDEAVRDIFKLQDRGKRKLGLRYEFTFQLKRISKGQKLPYRRYQIGYNFRDEPIKKGRTRQFIQCDCDVVGSDLFDEAEIFSMSQKVFSSLNIPVTIYINNRELMNEILIKSKVLETDIEAIIREIDKLDKLDKKEVRENLKKYGPEAVKCLDIFLSKDEKDFKKYENYSQIKDLIKICKSYGVQVEFRPYLARGFSYYNKTVFEVWSKKLGVAICGGGAYEIGDNQCFGISFGFEPLFLISEIEIENLDYGIISLGQDEKSVEILEKIRERGYFAILIRKNIKKAMEYANSKEIENVIVIGEEEVKKNQFKVKNMKTGEEEIIKF
jgi:histidyl-tRNA synthetase